VELNKPDSASTVYASAEQLRYAQVLAAGMRCGLAVLVAGFALYLAGWLPAHVPLEQMPALWTLSAPDYLRATGMPEGWGWVKMLDGGDVLPLLGIAILSGISAVCFAVLIPLYFAKRDAVYCAIAALEVAVLVLAASGVLTVGH
jgi:hypothetical protein